MPRLLGVHIPDDKKIEYSLTYVYGIGKTLSKKILKTVDISLDKKAKDLTQDELSKIKEAVEAHYLVEGDLKREVMMNVKRLKDISSWRGQRHSKRLPVRGQTTRINSRTVRGNKRATVGSGRKAAPSPK